PMESWRWPDGDGHIHKVVDAYEAAYPNLLAQDPNYPTPEYLRTIIRDGNIEFDGVFAKDTPGSDLIRSLILDDVPGPLYVMAWGGQSTIARALKSIQDEYEGTSEWEDLRRKIASKLILLTSGDQDDTGADYIRPVWPDVYPKGVLRGGIALGYGAQSRASAENADYYTAAWMAEHVSGKGALGSVYRVWGDGKGLVENDIFDYFGLSGYTDDELRALGYIVWTPVQEKGSWLGEGDTFTYLNLLNFGLRAREDDSYGGVGGYRRPAGAGDPEPGFLGDGQVADGSGGPAYPDFFQVVQNDFAARLDWSTSPRYEDANHPPRVGIDGPADIVAFPGETVRLSGSASDPDGDSVALGWWQFEAVDSYEGRVPIIDPTAASSTLEIPDDAEAGQTIHMVLQATDDAPLPLTRYQRIIITIGSR
ncbi:MAG: nucleoside hydrolase-like domain-containing protein, partial [Gammaproteobacteria bacterium]